MVAGQCYNSDHRGHPVPEGPGVRTTGLENSASCQRRSKPRLRGLRLTCPPESRRIRPRRTLWLQCQTNKRASRGGELETSQLSVQLLMALNHPFGQFFRLPHRPGVIFAHLLAVERHTDLELRRAANSGLYLNLVSASVRHHRTSIIGVGGATDRALQ